MDTLGDYAIIKPIGLGPFGCVYLAEHRFIKQQFAIKVFSEETTSATGFAQKWENLSQFLSNLNHPSLVKVHNLAFAEGKYFIVMDPVVDSMGEGMHLGRFIELKGKTLSEKEIESLLLQLASALDYLHQTTFFHGGFKPSNILVGRDEKGINLQLTDVGQNFLWDQNAVFWKSIASFALAKALSVKIDTAKEKELLKSSAQSFFYLSPEQKLHSSLTSKADTYAFGVLAYHLLTGEFPEGYFDFPSKKNEQLKLSWDHFLSECLRKDPVERPLDLFKKMEEIHSASLPSLPWKEVEKKVEDVLQMSFEFSAKKEEESSAFVSQDIKAALKPLLKPQEIQRPTYDPDPATVFQKDLSVSRYQPVKVEIKDVEPILTEMVVIAGGNYYRGSNQGARDEMPRHPVIIKSFALDIHPVTNEQFVRFLTSMGGEKDSNNNDIIRLRDSRIKRSGGKLIIESGYNRHPVVGVTWYGAVAYAKWVGKRLPTEAEWEIAACGGLENCSYPTGDDIERSQANFFSSDTTAVMSYPPNRYQLYDMAGNVYDWCQDWYAYNFYEVSVQEPENPQGPPQGVYRVLRGGCWKSLKEDLRCSHRHRNNPGAVNGTYGFRCAADVS
jgi:formylglycine-generating enzyme required for sulfatase activity